MVSSRARLFGHASARTFALRVLPMLLLLSAAVAARPGGGESYHGGSSSSGGGGSSSGGGDGAAAGLIIDLIILCIQYPPLGIVVVIALIVYSRIKRAQGAGLKEWTAGVPQNQVKPQRPHFVARAALDRLRSTDPQFSVVLFEDFLFTLYAQFHSNRPGRNLEKLSPYVAAEVRQAVHDDQLQSVNGIVIGALRYVGLTQSPFHVRLEVEVEANFTETRNGKPERLYVLERMILARPVTARSRPPQRARLLDCPNCGAPLEAIRGNVCSYCRERVDDGRFDWMLQAIHCVKYEKRPPLLTEDVVERGSELPTRVTTGVHQRLAELGQQDPAFQYEAFLGRVKVIFSELQIGWSNQDLMRIRPHVSDNLLQYFGYWFDVYLQAGARNVTENARILHIDLANLISDNVYDAITVRVFATGLDYTLGNDGRLLKGSRNAERPYTEYWTLIRGRATRGPVRTALQCPNCGAPLKINMAGNCEYCQAKVVTGDFDWVLSRIEQDEAYDG